MSCTPPAHHGAVPGRGGRPRVLSVSVLRAVGKFLTPDGLRHRHNVWRTMADEPSPRVDSVTVHALSNHLAVILGFVDLLLSETTAEDPRYSDLVEIRDAAIAAADLLARHRRSDAE